MKKFTLFLFATLFSALSFAALNPYAYGLSSELSLDEATLTVKYSLNADATGVNIVILNGETVVETISCDGKTKGNYTVEIPTASFPKSTSLTWQVEVLGNSVATPTKQTTTFSFYLPYSMDVDVDTESDYFGRWYVIEATNGGKGKSGYHSTSIGRGLYAFDAALEPIKNNSGTYGFTGGMTLGANTTNAAGDYINLACVTTSGGRVFVGRYEPGLAPILEATDLHSNNYPLVLRSGGGRAIALDARGRGENLQLVMLDTDFNIKEYDLGTAEEWTTAATPSRTFNKTGLIIDRNDAAIAYDNEGGLWVNQNSASNPTIAHLSTSGLDYDNITAGLSHILGAAKYNIRGVAINQDGTELAVPAAGRGKVTVFTISKDSEGKISLTQKYTITTGNNNTALSYDYAGNLYIANRSAETISFYAMPYDGEVSTPAASKYAFQLTEVVPEVYTVTVEKVGEGTIEGGGEYLENSTVTLKATPEEHYEFTGWTGDVTSNENPLTINVDGNKTITANFAKKQYTLTVFVNDENKGTIDVATGTHEYGTEVTLTATPKPGYKLLAWSNKATTPSITLTMDNNKAVSAYFVKEYATDPTFTIEKVWENTNVPPATANGFQGVGWDGKIYVKDRYNAAINVYTETGSELYAQLGATVTGLAGDQPIAVDDAGNLVVRSGSTNFYDSPTQVSIFRKNENTPEVIDFTLPATGRCDFISASGDIFGEKGGYVYFFCMNQTTVSRLHIKNGEYKGVDTIAIVAEEGKAASQSHVVVDIYGNIHTSSKGKNAYEYNITTLTTTADSYLGAATKKTPKSTIGGCTFELGGKELWAYVAGTTNYSSEWELKNVTDGVLVSEDVLYAKDKTTVNSNTVANWLNVQVVDEKTAYIYQFCPTVAAAVWKVSFKENYTVSASATNGTVTGAGTYQEGATATLTATPNTGYKFVNWTTGGVEVSTEATYSFPVTENVELVANFEALAQYTINAHADHTSKGYVTGGGDYYEGEEVVLKATAKSGYYFTQWNDGNTNNPRTITVDGDKEYIAEFAEAHPRAWAYDMKLGEDGDNYTFTFKATAAGQATITFKDKDGNALAQPASQTMATVIGENKFTIAKSDFESGVDAFWFITMDGDPIPAIAEVTDQTRGIYDFYNMMGVVVDNNTDSKDFGKIYVQASLNGKSGGITDRAKEQKAGIFIYNQELDELNDPSNTGYKPTVPSEYTEIGSSSAAFQRLNIHPKTGNLVYSHAIAGKPAVFAINRDDMTSTVTNLLTGVADMTRSVAHCFDSEGMLYVMNFADSKGTVYKVINGEATKFTETSNKFINAQITMASDGRGGLWISQNRGQLDDYSPYYYQLVHVSSEGEFDWGVDYQTPHGLEGSSSRGALAYDAERNILAQGRNGKVELYSVSYEPTITLTPLHTIASNDLGTNIDGLAFDYAGDLYVVNSSKEKFQKFSLPTTDNICTVAAPSSEAIRFTPVYTVSVESNNNEWGIVSGGGTFEEGQSATITAVAATNYKFVNWTKGSTEVSTANSYTFSVNETATYTANFVEKTKYTIDVTYDNTMGTVSGAGYYYEGTEVTLTAKANGGYVFVKWSDEVTDESRTFTASENVTLQAIFKVAIPRAWAYDLNMVEDGDDYKFTFTPTSAGNATILFTDKDGTPVSPTQEVVGAVGAGELKTVSIAKSQFTGAQDIYWSVKVEGEAITKMAEITDPTKGIYDVVTPQGIAIDNNTESDYFGQIYVAAATDGTVGRGAQTRGIFVYNPILNELNSPNVGNLPANVTLTDNTRQAIHRVAVSPTSGHVAFAYNISGSTAVWSMDPENLAGDAVNLIDGAGITKANSICFDENGILYVMDNANTGATGGQIYKVEDGVATLFAAHQAGYQWATEENSIVSDGRGGLWIAQNRWSVDAYPALSHVNKDGIVDFAVTTSSPEALKALFPHDDNNASYRGQCAYYVADDILAFGGNKEGVLFKVTYDANNTPTNLEKFNSTGKLGVNIDGLAFDYAGDLYVASESTHRFYKFVVPTNDNTCTVPAPMSQFIQKEARYTVTVVANEAAMGTVSAGGEYKAGEIITLTATANADYRFVNWTKGDEVLSTDASFSYTVPAENVTIVANFELKPLEMVGTVKRAVQIDDATIVLTHESNGTAHIYNVVNGEVKNELSQSSVVPVDTENAGDYLAISDIAVTEDGKLVACNYIMCQSDASRVDPGYKRGVSRFYIWDHLNDNPRDWFTSQMYSNWYRSKQGYTMAVKGTSTNAQIFTTGANGTNNKARFSIYNVKNGIYTEPTSNTNDYYHYHNGASDINTVDMTTVLGANYELNASPWDNMWIMDGNLIEPYEVNVSTTNNVALTNGEALATTLGKKYNGATYFTIGNLCFAVAPYADASGKVAGVKLIEIHNGLATAKVVQTLDLATPVAGTAAATAVKVNGFNLVITLVVDAAIYTFDTSIELSVTIDENADNTTALNPYDGENVKATVKRNFEPNKCYTLTLPFDMNASQIEDVFGNATVYEFYNLVEHNAEELYLEFIPTSSIQAGEPCLLVTPAGSFDANDGFTIEDVIISTTPLPVQVGAVTMMPVLDNGYLMDDPSEYYVWNGGLYCAGTYNMTSKGLRAYFVSSSPLPVRARVVLKDNEATSIPLVGVGQDDQVRKIMKDGQIIIIRGEEQYNIQGQRMD